MSVSLSHQSYGKSRVRITRLDRTQEPHRVFVIDASVTLEGAFEDSYLTGDNRRVVATDSIKNTLYVLAREGTDLSAEAFAIRAAEHFVSTYPQVASATVDMSQQHWLPITVAGADHPHAFSLAGPEVATARAHATENECVIEAGITDLQVLKSASSGFSDFVRDRYTTLQDATDRIFATTIEAQWQYASTESDFVVARNVVRDALLTTFANHESLSVQQTLYAMGQAALDAKPTVSQITLCLPNQHHLLVDLSPFELDNPNLVFQGTSEPFGKIQATLKR